MTRTIDGRDPPPAGSGIRVSLYTLYVWALLVVTLLPLWAVLAVVPGHRAADRLLKTWARVMLRLSGCPLRVRGLEHLRQGEPAVFVANHASYLDSVVVMAALPFDYRFVANHKAANWPLVGLAIRKAGHLVVDRTRLAGRYACAKAMLDTLRAGISLVVFPEGTIDGGGRLRPFQAGSFRVAVEGGRPVVPMTLQGTRHVLSRSVWRLRPGPLLLDIHQPIAGVANERREVARLRDTAHDQIDRVLRQAHGD